MAPRDQLHLSAAAPLFAPAGERGPAFASPREIAAALYTNRGWIAGCTLIVSLLALGLYAVQAPVYTSVARVLVQTEQLGAPSFLSGITPYRESQIPESANRRLETEMALITSQSNATDVVSALGITNRQLPRTPLAQAKGWLVDHTPEAVRKLIARTRVVPRSKASTDAATAEDLLADLSVEAVRSKTAETTSNVLEIKLKTADPALAPRALEALLAAYLRSSGEKGQHLGNATTALLNQQVKEAATELERVETSIVKLAARRSARTEGGLPGLNTGADSGTPVAPGRDASRAANDAAVTQLTNQVVDLQAKLDEQRLMYTEDAPGVRALRDRLAAARGRLSASVRNSATDNLDFTRLERQRSLLQDRYVELRRKRDQINLFTRLNPSALDGRAVIDTPSVPDEMPVGKSKIMLALGPVVGLLLGLLIAGLRELTDQRLRTPSEVERALGLPVLGKLPRLERTRVHAVIAASLSGPELKALELT